MEKTNEVLRVKEVLKEKSLTLTTLAQRMNITKGSLSAALNGNITINYLIRISEVLNCNVKDLIK